MGLSPAFRRVLVAVAVLLTGTPSVLATSLASAATVTHTVTFSEFFPLPTHTQVQVVDTRNRSILVPRFDPALGQLTEVEISAAILGAAQITGQLSSPSTFTAVSAALRANLTASAPGATALQTQAFFERTILVPNGQRGFQITFLDDDGQAGPHSVSVGSLATYVGTGSLTVPLRFDFQQDAASSFGSITYNFTADIDVTVVIVYSFSDSTPTATPSPTPTPTAEPTTSPTPEPSPTATPNPTPSPTPTTMQTPTPDPTASPTSEPIALCPETPASDCLVAHSAQLTLKDASPDSRDRLTVTWKGETTLADFGDPSTDANFGVCVYDKTGTLIIDSEAPAAGLCPSGRSEKPCWTAKPNSKGFSYVDRGLEPDGLQKGALAPAKPGRANGLLQIRGVGQNLDLPGPQGLAKYVADGGVSVTLQIHRSAISTPQRCWTASLGEEKRNTAQDLVSNCGSRSGLTCEP